MMNSYLKNSSLWLHGSYIATKVLLLWEGVCVCVCVCVHVHAAVCMFISESFNEYSCVDKPVEQVTLMLLFCLFI